MHAINRNGLGGRVAFRSYLKNHFGLGKDEVAAADRDVGGIIDESNTTIRQNVIGSSNIRNLVSYESKPDGYKRSVFLAALSRELAVFTPDGKVPSLSSGSSAKLLEQLTKSHGNIIASAVNSVVSVVSGDHPDWGALKRAVVFLADSLDKETGVARGFAMGELTEYMKNNLGMSDEYAQGLADTIIFNPSRYSPQGGQQQGANDGRGLQGVQQKWEGVYVGSANRDYQKKMAGLGGIMWMRMQEEKLALEDFL